MKKYFLYAILPAIVCVTIGCAAYANSNTGKTDPMSGLVTAIAQKFNLSASEVQQVFDDQRSKMETERKAEMEQKFTNEINTAVTNGNLTQDQANKIIGKRAELEAQRSTEQPSQDASSQTKTREEMDAARKAEAEALKTWATDNGIPTEYLRFVGMGGRNGFGGPMGHGDSIGPMDQAPANNPPN